MKKKLLAMVMTLAMVLSLVPVTALAEEEVTTPTQAETQATPQEGDTGGNEDPVEGTEEENQPSNNNPVDPQENDDQNNNEEEEEQKQPEQSENSEEEDSGYVAKIGTKEYNTLDGAIAAAQDGDTIELGKDCESSGIAVWNKTLTIQGDAERMPTITFQEYGIHTTNSNLTFQDCKIDMSVIGNDRSEDSGATCNLLNYSNMTLKHVICTITPSEEQTAPRHGIYLCGISNLNIDDHSEVHIFGCNKSGASGIYADFTENPEAKFGINVTDCSKVNIEDCAFNGMTINPCTLTIDGNSSVDISDCGNAESGKGGIGCYYGAIIISNRASLTVNDNVGKSWGIFAKELYMDETATLNVCNNVGYGLEIGGKGEIPTGANVTIEGNTRAGLVSYTGSNYWYGDVNIEQGANVEIHKNNQGIYVQPGGKLNMQDGNVTHNGGASYGGGLRNLGGTVVLGGEVAVYNNHAKEYGDDIYSGDYVKEGVLENTVSITFKETGKDWFLDDCDKIENCNGRIYGWYDDSGNNRWNAHDKDKRHIVEYDPISQKFKTSAPATQSEGEEPVEEPVVESLPLALKAAHPLMFKVDYVVTGDIPAGYTKPEGDCYPADSQYTVEAVPASVSATKDGVRGTYSFAGWTLGQNGPTVSGERTLTQDETLYGVWSFRRSGGGGGGGSSTVDIPDEDVPTGLDLKNHYGYIIGYPVDYYTGEPTTDQTKKPVRPEGKITRAEVATIYFRMLTEENRAANWNQVSGFSDVKSKSWYNNAISTLTKAGILEGYEDGTFRPNGYITRAEFATIAIRFFSGVYEGEDLFPDIKDHWARDYINNAADKGLVKGYEDGTFGPDRYITRAEAVTLVNRTLNRHPDKDCLHEDMLVWPDNMDTSKWYYADMQEATNSHEPDKDKSDSEKEYWSKTLPIRDWEALEKEWSNANSAPGEGEVV